MDDFKLLSFLRRMATWNPQNNSNDLETKFTEGYGSGEGYKKTIGRIWNATGTMLEAKAKDGGQKQATDHLQRPTRNRTMSLVGIR